MKETFRCTGHAVLNTYLYDKYYEHRMPYEDQDVIVMASMWYIPILDFDVRKLGNTRIEKARLTLQVVGENVPLEVECTTVSHGWNVRSATYYECDRGTPWARDKWASDVMMGQGHSVYFREQTSYDASTGALTIPIAPEIVYAMANGQSFGLGLVDCKSKAYATGPDDTWRDCDWLAAKRFNVNENNGLVPQLEVEFTRSEFAAPPAVREFCGIAAENPESDAAGVVLSWTKDSAETDEYRYYKLFIAETETDVSGMTPVDKAMVPMYDAAAGTQGAEIGFLKPDTDYWFAVRTANNGSESEPVYARVRTLGVRKPPAVETASEAHGFAAEAAVASDTFTIRIVDELCKFDPESGRAYDAAGEPAGAAGRSGEEALPNLLFDGERVTLYGCAGEKLAFQLIVDNMGTALREYTAAAVRDNLDDEMMLALHRVWYLKCADGYYPEAAVPLDALGSFTVPFAENRIPGQRFQALYVEVSVPTTVAPGGYSATIRIASGASEAAIPVRIEVADVRLARPDFTFELNGYIAPPIYMERDYRDDEFEAIETMYYRTGFEHNMTVNIVPYTHSGIVHPTSAPRIEIVDGLPRVTDWSEWDAHYGKYFDGSYAVDGCRKQPISHCYLPFHENWPMPINAYYTVQTDVADYPQLINDVKVKTTTVADDFRPGYREGIKAVLKDFIVHIEEKGWTHTQFHYFFNNKHFYKERRGKSDWLVRNTTGSNGSGTSWWLLDEPVFRDDWEALAYYGSILKEAQRELNAGYNVHFRVDVSGYNQMFDFLDGVLDLAIVNSRVFRDKASLLRERKLKYGEQYWVYGSWNPINRPNTDILLQVVDTYVRGGTGFIPWNNFARDDAYEKPTDTAALYPGNRFGLKQPVVSLRIKAARKGLELMKYLETFKRAFGYSDLQMKAYVSHFLQLDSQSLSRHRDDAGVTRYAVNAYSDIARLKRDLLEKLKVRMNGSRAGSRGGRPAS